MKVFVFDHDKCNGCYGCQMACKDEHCNNDWAPIAAPQPETGQFWLHLRETEHGQIPKVRIEYKPVMCNHCDDAPCVAAFPEAAYKRSDGLVIIDPVKAKGCEGLVDACPYGVVFYNTELQLPQKCTGCAHLVDAGEQPRCVDFCATGALRFGDEEDFADEIARACTLEVADGTGGADGAKPAAKPRVYYLNNPKLFISGDVWDPERDEIVKGAAVTLTDKDGNMRQTFTDGFGDFWFKQLDAGTYDLAIEAQGYQSVQRKGIVLDKSLNVGDFPLSQL